MDFCLVPYFAIPARVASVNLRSAAVFDKADLSENTLTLLRAVNPAKGGALKKVRLVRHIPESVIFPQD